MEANLVPFHLDLDHSHQTLPCLPGQHILVVSDLVHEWPFYPDRFWLS